MGFTYATKSGLSIGHADMVVPDEKQEILQEAYGKVQMIGGKFRKGFMTDNERYNNAIRIWSQTKSDITNAMIKHFQKIQKTTSIT